MMQSSITDMTAQHIDEVYEIEQQRFSQPWSYELLKAELNNERAHYFVGLADDKVVGYAGVTTVLDTGEITNIAVREDYSGEGIGSALMQRIIDYCKDNSIRFLNLEVREGNLAALNMYKKFGFVQVGRRKNYYNLPVEAAILMTKEVR